MINNIKGYKCNLCGDIVYKRNTFDSVSCRCGNIFSSNNEVSSYYGFQEVELSLGDGVDENVLAQDYLKDYDDYGLIESDIDGDKLNVAKAEVLLLKESR